MNAGENGIAVQGIVVRRKSVFLSIGEAARVLGVSPSSLRNWEAMGLITPIRSQGRYRLYSPEVLQQAKRIRYLRNVKHMNPYGILHVLEAERKNGSKVAPSRSKRGEGIGSRLSRLRHERDLTLSAAAQKTGLSPSFLSSLERGQVNASIATLQKLAQLYKTNILSFFGDTDETARRLVRPRERKILQPHPGVKMELLAFGETLMEPHLFRIAPGASSGGSYHHEGEEFIYVLQGKLEVWLDEIERYVLEAGDSLYFESTQAHRWNSLSEKETLLLWINTPPTF